MATAEGVKNVEAIAAASARMHGISLGPADLAASRAMKTTRVGGGHPDYVVLEDSSLPISGKPDIGGAARQPRGRHQQDLWHYTIAKMVDATASAGIKELYGRSGTLVRRLRGAVPQRVLMAEPALDVDHPAGAIAKACSRTTSPK